jgi:hypothetical protein
MTSAQDLQLTGNQYVYARRIIKVVHSRGLPQRVGVIALETALTESGLQMYANANNPQSLTLPHDAVGSDHASVGLFQQQVPLWGTTANLMNAEVSCGLFLDHLPGNWPNLQNWVACQDVQNSAYDGVPRKENHFSNVYGGNYLAQDARANRLVGALWNDQSPIPASSTPPTKFFVDTFADAPVFAQPGTGHPSGTLFKGTNYVFGKRLGPKVGDNTIFNHFWMKTVPDEGSGQWVSAYFLARWGNDEAKDNNGVVLPNV